MNTVNEIQLLFTKRITSLFTYLFSKNNKIYENNLINITQEKL